MCTPSNVKIKMKYLKTILISLIILKTDTASGNPIFLVTNGKCVTNSSSAIAFNTPVDYTKDTLSEFFPQIDAEYKDIDCKIDEDECTKELWISNSDWTLENSIDGHIKKPITDWRWEALPLCRTKQIDKYERKLNYEYVLNFKDEDFDIPISVRTEKEAHVYLCEDYMSPHDTNCYWFMLQAFKGTKSALRKCNSGFIDEKYGEWPEAPCSNNLMENERGILSEAIWKHFRIIKKSNTFSLIKNNEELLHFTDDKPFPVKHMFIHSKGVNGLWKIHKYSYIYCTNQASNQLGPEIQFVEGETCISMFIIMCSSCQMIVKISADDLNVYEQTFKTEDENWKEIKILLNSTKSGKYKLYVITFSSKDTGKFWAIDHVRRCSQKEYRILKLQGQEQAPCQIVENEETLDFGKLKNEEIHELGTTCPESTIGEHCIPCQMFGNKFCNRFKYCESFGANTQCFCTSGYISKNCDKECDRDQYGHGCRQYCGKCNGDCNHVNGHCSEGCRNEFSGDKCDIPPVPLFKYPPKIVHNEPTSCTVQILNFDIDKRDTDETPRYFKIQYKKTSDGSSEWQDASKLHNFPDFDKIVIENLEPDTEYYVGAVLSSNKSNIYQGDIIKSAKFRTPCNDIQPDDIIIKAENTSVLITFKLYHLSCRINNYMYSIANSDRKGKTIAEPATQVLTKKLLKPFTNYVLTLSHAAYKNDLVKNFTTTEGVPSKAQELETVSTSSRSISLKWKAPKEKNGIIQHYLVTYRFIKGKECPEPINPPHYYETKTIEETTVSLDGLHPHSIYEITVSAVTNAGSGQAESIQKHTQILEALEENEIPTILRRAVNLTSVILFLSTLDCNKRNGPIYLSIEAKCEEEWCLKPTTHTGLYSPMVALTNLFADVNYKLVLNVSRTIADLNNTRYSFDQFETFKTGPIVPSHIQDLTVTSKNESSISLRWKPPYPPTGTLKKYRLKYKTQNAFKEWNYTKEIDPTYCKLWHNFHCATITEGIGKNWEYKIQIWATNESPWQYVRVTREGITVCAKVEEPEFPYDLMGNWKKNNDLLISWKHPNATNGLLKSFTIQLNTNKKEFVKKINSEDDYNLTYTYQINHTDTDIEPCSKYTVTVVAHNENSKSIPAQFIDWSPPPIPPSILGRELKTNSTNHTITIEIPSLQYQVSSKINCQKKLYLLIAESMDTEETHNEVINFKNFLLGKRNDPNLTYYRLLLETDQRDVPITFKIGSDVVTQTRYNNFSNPPLKLGKAYNVNLFLVNECNRTIRYRGVNKTVYTTGNPNLYVGDEPGPKDSSSGLYSLIILILLVPLLIYIYMYIKRQETTPDMLTILKRPQRSTVVRQPKKNKKDDEIPQRPAKPSTPTPMVKLRASVPGNIASVLKTKHSKRIKINDFELYVKESIANEELERQHGLFPRGQTKPWDYGALKANKPKNRYNNLIAYDHTRVKLNQIPGVAHADYINANYIDGYRVARAYIATQGPKPSTLDDFWRMIWKENVKHIIMLANLYEGGKKKVEKYWPDINEEKDFSGIRVQYVSTEVFANYEFRVFNVYNKDVQRKVEQLHFTSWPDHGVPLYSQSLVPFLRRILKIPNSTHSPVVIHCSAGVGRTGTIILCDICLRMAAGEGSVDFLAHLENIRGQRANMVDNVEQYKLAHLVVLECLFGMNTAIACNDDMEKAIENVLSGDGIKSQLRYLVETEWQDKAMDTVWDIDEVPPTCPEKNRFQDIIPETQHQIFLLRHPPQNESSSYINAIQVDGFRSPDRFIVTQQPMPNTLGDFWRLVVERMCTVVISLNKINKNDQTSCQFWPEKDSKIKPVDYLQISHVSSTLLGCYSNITVRVVNLREKEETLVNIISMNNWMPNDLLPNSLEEYLSFWEESDALSRQSVPVIVTCYNGATASGLYIATSFIIEKMKLEQECDVCLAVRSIRHTRKQFVANEEQFEFLYRAALTYISGFQSYANFA